LSFVGVIAAGQEGGGDDGADAGSKAVDLDVKGTARFLLEAPLVLAVDALLAVEGFEKGDDAGGFAGADIAGEDAAGGAALGVVVAAGATGFPGHENLPLTLPSPKGRGKRGRRG